MNKPLIFALRGAVGFGLTTLLMLGKTAILGPIFRNIPIFNSLFIVSWVVYFLLAAALGSAVLFYGMPHWKQTVLCFAASFLLVVGTLHIASMRVSQFSGDNIRQRLLELAVIWVVGLGLFGGVGGLCRSRYLVLPGAVAFGLPGLFLGLPAFITLNPVLLLIPLGFSLAIGGALFGFFMGRCEDHACLAPPLPD